MHEYSSSNQPQNGIVSNGWISQPLFQAWNSGFLDSSKTIHWTLHLSMFQNNKKFMSGTWSLSLCLCSIVNQKAQMWTSRFAQVPVCAYTNKSKQIQICRYTTFGRENGIFIGITDFWTWQIQHLKWKSGANFCS